ncbi:MAG: hypothetical protein C0448_03720 [Sphingobacteriaceae bacterium]|nr:hypothetical protein [Sphingobacteriaceae bacterium]
MKKHLLVAITFFCTTLSLSAQIPTNGLVAKWSFDGNLTADSHGSYTLNNGGSGAVLSNGYQGNANTAAYFNGNAIMGINNAAFRPTTFSMATWFKMSGTEPYHTLANVRLNPTSAPYNSYNLCIGNSTLNYLAFFFTTSSSNDIALYDTSFTSINVWAHATITCDYNSTTNNTTVKMYVDGLLHSQTTQTGNIIYSNTPFNIGSVGGAASGNSLDGSLDEFLFYNRVLSPSEVATIYNGTSTDIHSSNNTQHSQITLYPNPTSSILNIDVKEQTQITIVNVLGDIVLTQPINGLSEIDVSKLTSGVYFIKDATSGRATKFIKE